MRTTPKDRIFGLLALTSLGVACLSLQGATASPAGAGGQEQVPATAPQDAAVKKPKPQDTAQYVGARVCGNCHRNPAKGEQYQHWKDETTHVNAFKTLGSEQAKQIAERRGLGDPQQAPECLRCHVAAHGVEEKRLARTFRKAWGVQCESCHGPGGYHQKQRIRDPRLREVSRSKPTTLDIPADEIAIPTEQVCRSCHNPDSPTYKEYHHKSFLPKVAHVNPQRPKPWLPESLPSIEKSSGVEEPTPPDDGSTQD